MLLSKSFVLFLFVNQFRPEGFWAEDHYGDYEAVPTEKFKEAKEIDGVVDVDGSR